MRKTLLLFVFHLSLFTPLLAQITRTWGEWDKWGEQQDGTYLNPVIPADYSDLDCIRVGDDYYAISSTSVQNIYYIELSPCILL